MERAPPRTASASLSPLARRGYGFVKFGEEGEQKKAIEECQGTMLGGKPLRLSIAVAKR